MTVSILVGDVRDRLAQLAPESVDCVVTSPPYWGLRDYGVAGQIGLEASLVDHIAVLVDVFRLVRRALKPSGTLWLNYGDCYASAPNGRSAEAGRAAGGDDRVFRDKPVSTVGGAIKPKDLCLMPARLAIALQEDGWWVRSEIVWGKPNAMPDSSGRYRPSVAHEKWWLLTRSDRCDFWAAKDTGEISAAPDLSEQAIQITTGRPGPRWQRLGHYYDAGAVRVETDWCDRDVTLAPQGRANGAGPGETSRPDVREVNRRTDKQRGHSRRHAGFNERWDQMSRAEQRAEGRLLRNFEPAPLPVWEVATRAFRGAHFATFPPELVERCLDAGCPPGGVVLDPFGGSGTTGLVADGLGLDCILIEINPDYAEMARRRIAGNAGLFASVVVEASE